MPNNYDFSRVSNVRTAEFDIDGWASPITVEWGTGFHGEVPAYFWRVRGTKHTFVIPILRMDYLSQGDYEKHFKEALSVFREDYLEWREDGFQSEWMQEYARQFDGIISA